MRTVMRPRYYCEFCGRGNGSPSAMKKHERGCTANPNRECGLCREADIEQKPLTELVTALGSGDNAGVEAVRQLAEGCPGCILAAIRASKLQHPYLDDNDTGFSVPYNFRDELNSWWNNINYYRNRDVY